MKSKLLITLAAALLTGAANVKAAAFIAPPGRSGFLNQPSDDLTWGDAKSGPPDSAVTAGGDETATSKAEVMKKKKKKKKKSKAS